MFVVAAGVAAGLVVSSHARAQCVSNGGNYVITQSTGAIDPGTADVGNHVDDAPETTITLPFTWSFYGTPYTQVQLDSNGQMTFGATGGSTAFGNACPPTTTFTGPTMMPYWDDLRTDNPSTITAITPGIYTSVSGVAPNRIFNIEWKAVYFATPTAYLDMEVRLYENLTRFDFVYGDSTSGGSGGTIGCQQAGAAGSRFTQFACNTAAYNFPAAGTVLTFDCQVTPVPSCSLAATPASVAIGDPVTVRATIIPGTPPSPPYTFNVDASQLNAGTVQLFDDGNPAHGDAVAGDGVYSNIVTVGAGTTNGVKTLTSTVTDSAVPAQSSACATTVTANTVAMAATGTATPATGIPPGGGTLLVVNVTPATGPTSTNIQVHADLTNIGGSASQILYDDGTHGDATANDNHYSFSATVGSIAGNYNLPFTVTDAQSRTASGTIFVGVYDANAVWDETINGGGDTGDTLAGAQTVNRPTPHAIQITGSMGAANDADIYLIHICEPANFIATTAGGTTIDTQLFLFDTTGHGVVHDDDDWVTGTLQSRITSQFVSSHPAGDYYLAITGYNQDPYDAGGNLIWNNTCPLPTGGYQCERVPDGPGAANAFDHWVAGTTYTGNYTILLGGVSGASCGPLTGRCCTNNTCHVTTQAACTGTWTAGAGCVAPGSPGACPALCGSSDFNCDGDTGTDADIEAFFACLSGTCPPLPCISSADFNGDGDTGTDADIEAFFRVLSGGAC
jgi:hypothetical protein